MKFFIDSAMIEEIKHAALMGMVDGVTTNPSLIAKTGKTQKEVILNICEIVKGPVSAEVISVDYEGMIREAGELAKWASNIVVKLPLTESGLKATRWCADQRIKTNVTLCFSPLQALMAAKAGASFISPFVGRLDDISQDGMALIRDIVTIYENYQFKTEVLVASVRHPRHIVDAALMGAHVVTVPLDVMKKILQHPLTESGLEKFLADHKKATATPAPYAQIGT